MTGFLVLSWADVLDHLLKLAIAYMLAFPIGWIQERAERSAGIRTFPLVALASCGLMLVALKVLKGSFEAEARVLEGLIAGIGFIGGGAILKGKRAAHGTATAASVWNVGIIGAATAYGLYDIAAILSLVNAATLLLLTPLKKEPVSSDAKTDSQPTGLRPDPGD